MLFDASVSRERRTCRTLGISNAQPIVILKKNKCKKIPWGNGESRTNL